MEAIAREARVTKPVVYGTFANLGALLETLLDREEERALAQLAAVLPSQPAADPDELVVEAFVAFLGAVASRPESWRLILMPAEGTPAVVREHVEAGRRQIRERIDELLGWGIAARGGPAGLDVELASHGLVAVGEHLGRLVLTSPREFTPERAGEFVRTLLGALE